MKNKCKIVVDLLPSYIEKITSEETNHFVEEHLNTCKECKKIYDEMISEIEKDSIENTEIIRKIKKYKRKLIILKSVIIFAILIITIGFFGNVGFKYYIIRNAILKNNNYDASGNFRIEEYKESIERYDTHITTYFIENRMRKVDGDDVIEYWELFNHYYIDNENKTYRIEYEDIRMNNKLNIPINSVSGMENLYKDEKINFAEAIKFIFNDDIKIGKEAFRNEEYYIIKNLKDGTRVYFDKDTFFAERVEYLNNEEDKEYRVLTNSVSWYEVDKPDLIGYTLQE